MLANLEISGGFLKHPFLRLHPEILFPPQIPLMASVPVLSEEHGKMKAMQLERSGLVPIGEAVSGLDDELVPALRDASPQARRCGPPSPDRADRPRLRQREPTRLVDAPWLDSPMFPRQDRDPTSKLTIRSDVDL